MFHCFNQSFSILHFSLNSFFFFLPNIHGKRSRFPIYEQSFSFCPIFFFRNIYSGWKKEYTHSLLSQNHRSRIDKCFEWQLSIRESFDIYNRISRTNLQRRKKFLFSVFIKYVQCICIGEQSNLSIDWEKITFSSNSLDCKLKIFWKWIIIVPIK